MATTNISYGTTTDIPVTALDGNGDNTFASSAIVDNQTNKFVDAMVGGTIQVGTVTADGTLDFYLDISWDGTEFAAGCDAGDTDITWGTTGSTTVNGQNNLIFLGSVDVDSTDDNSDFPFGGFSIAGATGGIMPAKWTILVRNNTGVALHATGTNNHLEYRGITFTSG